MLDHLRSASRASLLLLPFLFAAGCQDAGASKGDINQSIADHAAQPAAHHAKTIDASELTTGTLAAGRLPAVLQANDFQYSAAKTSQRRVSFSSFAPRAAVGVLGVQRGFIFSTLANTNSEGYASLELPLGATVTRFACTMKKTVAGGPLIGLLYDYDPAGNETEMARVTSLVTGAAFAEVSNSTIASPVIVANHDYVIGVVVDSTGQSNVMNTALQGCTVEFTASAVAP